MLLILKAQRMSIPFGAKLLKSQMTALFTELMMIIQVPHHFCQTYASISQVFTKRAGENEIVCGFTMTFTKMFFPSAPVHLLEW